MKETAGYLPDIGEDSFEWKTLTFQTKEETVKIEIPMLTDSQMNRVVEKVKTASREVLKKLSVMEIVNIIDEAVHLFLDRRTLYRQKAELLLPLVTGYDREMVRLALTSYLKGFRKPELQRFLVEDFGNPLLLDDFEPRAKRGFSKAVGPDLLLHIWAGNVPALPLWSLISGLLVKAGNIGKVASAEPLFAGWFAQALVEIEPKLADCLAVVWWKGGDEGIERALFQQADVVAAYGSNASLESLRTRMPLTTRLLPYGHKMSFGVVSNVCLDSRKAWETAHQAAYDVIRYDQQGCYSPHTFFVQRGGKVSPQEFAKYVAHELECFEKKYPRRVLSMEELAKAAVWRQKEELSVFSKPDKAVLGDSSCMWTVVYEEELEGVTPSCLNRTIKVIAVDEWEEILSCLKPYRSFLQTFGIAASPKELFHLADLMGRAGATRITALGRMTSPEAALHHDGRFSLLDFVNMVDIEHSAEDDAERFAPYTD